MIYAYFGLTITLPAITTGFSSLPVIVSGGADSRRFTRTGPGVVVVSLRFPCATIRTVRGCGRVVVGDVMLGLVAVGALFVYCDVTMIGLDERDVVDVFFNGVVVGGLRVLFVSGGVVSVVVLKNNGVFDFDDVVAAVVEAVAVVVVVVGVVGVFVIVGDVRVPLVDDSDGVAFPDEFATLVVPDEFGFIVVGMGSRVTLTNPAVVEDRGNGAAGCNVIRFVGVDIVVDAAVGDCTACVDIVGGADCGVTETLIVNVWDGVLVVDKCSLFVLRLSVFVVSGGLVELRACVV